MMKNDTQGFDAKSNKEMEPGCNSDDCSIRVLYSNLEQSNKNTNIC